MDEKELNLEEMYPSSVEGDNGELCDTDWVLEGAPDSLLAKIQKLPKVEIKDYYNRNQMVEHGRWDTACTWVSGMNIVYTTMGVDIPEEHMIEAEQLAVKNGWVYGKGWSRGQGLNVARNIWNKHYPENKIETYVGSLDSPEVQAYLESGRLLHVSINVNHRRWSQAYQGKVNVANFTKGVGHATVFKEGNGYKLFLDSGGLKKTDKYGVNYEVTEEVIRISLKELRTLRGDVHMVIPENTFKLICDDVPPFQWYSDGVKFLVEEGLTTETKKFRPHDKITRAEMAVFLKRFYDKFIK